MAIITDRREVITHVCRIHSLIEEANQQISKATDPSVRESLKVKYNNELWNLATYEENGRNSYRATKAKMYGEPHKQTHFPNGLGRLVPNSFFIMSHEDRKGYFSGCWGRFLFYGYIVSQFDNCIWLDQKRLGSLRSLIASNKPVYFEYEVKAPDMPVWWLERTEWSQDFVCAVMERAFMNVMTGRLRYSVIDPVRAGGSISSCSRKILETMPELFGGKIYVSKGDISAKLSQLQGKVERIRKLFNGCSIWNYVEANPYADAEMEMLVLFDFPKGFDENTLAALQDILNNGRRCGICALIVHTPHEGAGYSDGFLRRVEAIRKLSTIDMMLPVSYLRDCWTRDLDDLNLDNKYLQSYSYSFELWKNRELFVGYKKDIGSGEDFIELSKRAVRICRESGNDYYWMEVVDYCTELWSERFAAFSEHARIDCADKPYDEDDKWRHAEEGADAILQEQFGRPRVPFAGTDFPDRLTVGRFCAYLMRYKHPKSRIEGWPFFLKFDAFHLFLNAMGTGRENMVSFSHQIIWRFLADVPVMRTNICVFDAERHGGSITPFLDFYNRSPATFDQKIHTSAEEISLRLRKFHAQMDECILKKLGNQYKNILEYNAHTSHKTESLTLLVWYDFPVGLDSHSLDMLTGILKDGEKCGIYAILCYNPDIAVPRQENMEERIESLQKMCANVLVNGYSAVAGKDSCAWRLPFPSMRVDFENWMRDDDIPAFVDEYLKTKEQKKKEGVPFSAIWPQGEEIYASDSAESLRISVGIGDGDAVVDVVFGEGSSHHGLIAGATGSGKSVFLHTLIMSGMIRYSPEQLNLYLMDFKEGLEFKIYGSARLPHIKLLALSARQEFGESILEELVREMERRAGLFKEAGQRSISGYTQRTKKPMPRILVIIDEFQNLFNESSNKMVARHCNELTKRIVMEGRAAGIHLLMATQSTKVIANLALSRETVEQMRIRIGLKCGEDDAKYLFGDQDGEKALEMMKGPVGTAVMNRDYTEQANIGLRTAYCDAELQKECLEAIAGDFSDSECTTRIFEGGRTYRLLDHYRESGTDRLTSELPVKIAMGRPTKVAPPFEICVDKKKKHNLLVCGTDEKMANNIAANYMISALLNENAAIYCFDGDYLVDDTSAAPFYEMLARCKRFDAPSDRAEMIRRIHDAYSTYQESRKGKGKQVLFLVFKNLRFLDIIQSMLKREPIEESDYIEDDAEAGHTESAPPAAADPMAIFSDVVRMRGDSEPAVRGGKGVGEKLVEMIEKGSAYGVHFVVTCTEYQVIRDAMVDSGNKVLTCFPERILFSLNEGTVYDLLRQQGQGISLDGMEKDTVCFTDGIDIFQMKPYVAPELSELKEFMGSLRR